MRALAIAALALAACQPDIGYGTYECGPEAACPSGQACDETMDRCVAVANAAPFQCDVGDDEPDNDLAHATSIAGLTCVSTPQVLRSCLASGDALDLYTFATPSTCASVSLTAVLDSSIAYETLTVTVLAADGTTVVADAADCPTTDPGRVARCLTTPLQPGTSYVLRVAPAGGGDCGGACAFNRYSLTVQLTL